MSEKEQILQPLNKNFKEPKLRFRGFQSLWNSIPFLDLFTNFTTNSLSWDFLNYEEGLIKNLHYGLIHSSKFSIFDSSNAPFINNDYIPKKYTLYKTNDLILADTSEDKKDVGKPLELKLDEYPIVCGLHTMHFREKKNVTIPFFKSYYFSSNMYHRFTYKYSEGVKVFSLKPSLFKYFVFSYPCKDEQEKIVNFLKLMDKKINLIEAKISILKKYKKGLIIYLLTNGIKTEKFVDYIEYISKTSFASGDGKEKGKYPFYINSTDGNYKFTDSYTHEGKHLIVNTGGQAFIQISEEKFSAMADNLIIKIRKNLYGVYYYLKGIESRINYIGFQGTGIRHLDQNWLKRQYVILPPISDKKIEALEENTNNYIKILEIKLKKLHLIKMQLMKDLFI